jgi:serine protease Do
VRGLSLNTVLAAFCACAALAAHAGVTPELQHAIRAATYEVVMKKPDKDPVSYEKPLPLDLLPFIERNDAYLSIGTAFALGHNTYVTAAHVIALGIGSQYGAPALRRSDGTVLAIDRILQFSQHEDFVVFSLVNDPGAAGFTLNREPKLDDPVLAVGNALGEGIVIRDGLFTSETAEEQDGQWKWIRFSAAASPGNSGGPLLDSEGQVIGVVIGKSPNENLNYSLPIARVLDADRSKARFDRRELVALPYLHGTYTYSFKDNFSLPLNWPDFVKAFQGLTSRHDDEARSALLKTYESTAFPKGPGSETLLFEPDPNGFRPRVITQQADGRWSAFDPDYSVTDLSGDGSVSVASAAGAEMLRLIRSNGASDTAFYADSKAFMDLALKGLDLSRRVGSDEVRVTSLGTAQSESLFVDQYGRKWQERIWPVPFLDFYLVALLLPTPDGYAGIVEYAHSSDLHDVKSRIQLVAGQVDISYTGTLAQWQAYLRRTALLPAALANVKLEPTPQWSLRSQRFISAVPSAVLPRVTEKSPLSLTMGFMNDGPRVVFDVQEVWWFEDDRKIAALGLWRRERPPAGAKLDLRNRFSNIRQRRAPFDGEVIRETTEEFDVSRVLEVPGKKPGMVSSDLLYGVTLHLEGYPAKIDTEESLQAAAAGTQILEAGIGDDVAGVQAPVSAFEARLSEFEKGAREFAEKADAALGRDIRGRRLSDDVSDYLAGLSAGIAAKAAGRSPADTTNWMNEQRLRLDALQEYWKQYPAVTHNRDMWSAFLSRNGMPADTAHSAAVLVAERLLLKALESGVPAPEWAERAHQLKAAYIEERSTLVKRVKLIDANYRPRVSPCPAPSDGTSGTRAPKLGRLSRPLSDFYPAASRRLGEEGVVLVSFRIASSGCATAAAIVGSSGSEFLDEAVLQFYETMEFIPAGPDGTAVDATVSAPIVFKLTF